ncbi:MAG: hypothetical protein A2W91_18450 [Bacteroidetes bacterium GWF2_38_335]|nr:MAG: hypothetical protein A2W91_18450 [Bacteroidetes bacterium GWF2_38_335]OFY78215.1 MAG: hypothetical protein A2281_04615 [Bacteroidetes bacterium RIFOXYA12_FULL_38_20]HBS88622.1 hypothetical protein [Bacteroidales bacterium]
MKVLSELYKIPVPEEFFSDLDNKQLSHCLVCGKELIDSQSDYMIEKVFQVNNNRKTTIFEHAICMECSLELRKSLSTESLANIENYFRKNVDFIKRNELLIENNLLTSKDWLSHCIVKKTPLSDCSEYQTYCLCKGKYLNPGLLPYLVSEEVILEINELLSVKTKNEIDGFIDKYYGFPPEYRELMYGKKLIFV